MTMLVPYLTFRDGDASLAFLRDVLRFELVSEQRDDDGGVVHAELKRGEAVIMGGAGDAQPSAVPGLYLVLPDAADVDATFARAIEAGGAIGYEPEDTEWGTRRARIRDLDGHEWSFGTYEHGRAW